MNSLLTIIAILLIGYQLIDWALQLKHASTHEAQNIHVFIQISLKFALKNPIISSGKDMEPTGNKPLPEPIITQSTSAYIYHLTSVS